MTGFFMAGYLAGYRIKNIWRLELNAALERSISRRENWSISIPCFRVIRISRILCVSATGQLMCRGDFGLAR